MACCGVVQHNEEMDEDEARRRFEAARVGRLATVTPNRMPHLVPVVFALVDDFLYTAVDDKPKTTVALQRLANIDATGRASLLVGEYTEDWPTLWWARRRLGTGPDRRQQRAWADRTKARTPRAGWCRARSPDPQVPAVGQPTPDWTCHRVTCDAMAMVGGGP